MLHKAAQDLGLQLQGSFMVGDRPGDVECALSAGLYAVRVLSGPDQTEDDKPAHMRAQDLAGAVEWILAQLESGS